MEAGSVLATDREHGHGRTATRCLKATEIEASIGFPHAVQVLQLTHKTRRRPGARLHTEIVYAVTSLSATDAHPSQVAGWLRGHWGIENRIHWVRDVTFDEDRSQIRTNAGPQVMATLRNTAISFIRLSSQTSIRRRPTTSQPRPTPPNHTPADLLKYDFAGALAGDRHNWPGLGKPTRSLHYASDQLLFAVDRNVLSVSVVHWIKSILL